MLDVVEAQKLALQHAQTLPAEVAPLASSALGLALAEDVVSDVDIPSCDKALMDGYAIRSADLLEGQGTLTVIEEITAGQMPRLPIRQGQTSRIMTGAAIPSGADAIVMIERTRLLQTGCVQIDDSPPKPGQNVLRKGRETRQGETVLKAGAVLRPQEFGILATVGRTTICVHARPRVGILSTGDEVVEPSQTPGPGQIRNGNGPMLLAQVCRAGGLPRFLGIAKDRVESLRPLVAEGLRSDILLLSGGVSAGKLDLVPGVLQELGVEAHFHKVNMKPGKPIFFGTRGATMIFGLPGNPVSSLVCFELFVRPAIRKILGHPDPEPRWLRARLVEDFPYRTDRPTYYPACLESGEDGWLVRPLPWGGSWNLRSVAHANALILFPTGEHEFQQGERLPVLSLE